MMSRIARVLVALLLPSLLIAAAAFFVLQTYTGSFGRLALENAELRQAGAAREVARLEAEVNRKRARNGGLHDGTLDLDLLDERARAELGMIRPDEVFLVEE